MIGNVTNYSEIGAKDKKGFLLYSPIRKEYFFRIYNGKNFKDYSLLAEEIEIKILDDSISLYENEERNILDFSTKVLDK